MSETDKTGILDAGALNQALANLEGWSARGEAITRTFKFDDFKQAFGFMAQVALMAEKADHHPDWSNSYGKVVVSLSTHEKGGVTARDIELAGSINRLV